VHGSLAGLIAPSDHFYRQIHLLIPHFALHHLNTMVASTQTAVEDIERRRMQLQQNVDQLRKALSHWTTWEAEYEALKEEIEAAGDPSPSQLREIARDLECSLVTEKDVEELLCKDPSSQRTANQVVDLISRRLDYVRTNSATVEKNLDAAEKKLAGVDVLLEPGMDNEEGEPMMAIEEELDEAGNEVSSSVNQTGKAAAELLEVLRKAGIQKAELEKNATPAKEELSTTPLNSEPPTRIVELAAPSSMPTTPTATSSNSKARTPTKKTVSFAEKVDVEPSKPPTSEKNAPDEDHAILKLLEKTGGVELNEDGDLSEAIIPEGESPEDAELRRQMLQYGMSEVGQIVAELDLDQPTASYSDDETDDDYGDYDTEDEEEDQYGRNTKPVVTVDYRKQMMELEKKLGARMLENIGPQSDDQALAEHIGDIRTMKVQKDEQFDESLDTAKSKTPLPQSNGEVKKRGVRFADDVDISDAPKPAREPVRAAQPTAKSTSTISNTIVERSAAISSTPVEPSKPAKVSRFKSARAGAKPTPQMLPTPAVPEAPPVPTGPSGRTLATTITEHSPLPSEPQAPDEFDPLILNREIQADYHMARNRFIQRQGGFKAAEEDEENPLVEERDGKPKKVSRFLAAKLKADGL
jgi:unconventional prefoldin RPB5 interactor 1